MEEILIIKLGALGDIVQAEGAIHDIRLHHRNARISVLTTAPYRKIMQRCPWVDSVIIDPRCSWLRLRQMNQLRSKLRNSHFDMVYDLQQVDRTRLYRRLFLPDVPWMGDSRSATYYRKRAKDCCAADHFTAHLKIAGIAPHFTCRSDASWMADEPAEILKFYRIPDYFIALLPGGSAEHPQKRWPGYPELARKIRDAGLTPVTIPGPDEMELCRSLPAIPLLGDNGYLDYFQMAGILAKAAYIVGNDSGPTHIGAHLGRPGLALFGGHTSAASTGIQHTNFHWMEVDDLQQLDLAGVWQKFTDNAIPA